MNIFILKKLHACVCVVRCVCRVFVCVCVFVSAYAPNLVRIGKSIIDRSSLNPNYYSLDSSLHMCILLYTCMFIYVFVYVCACVYVVCVPSHALFPVVHEARQRLVSAGFQVHAIIPHPFLDSSISPFMFAIKLYKPSVIFALIHGTHFRISLLSKLTTLTLLGIKREGPMENRAVGKVLFHAQSGTTASLKPLILH